MTSELQDKNSDKATVEKVVATWNKGVQFEDDGYGDLGFTLKQNALEDARKLDKNSQIIIADILFPIN